MRENRTSTKTNKISPEKQSKSALGNFDSQRLTKNLALGKQKSSDNAAASEEEKIMFSETKLGANKIVRPTSRLSETSKEQNSFGATPSLSTKKQEKAAKSIALIIKEKVNEKNIAGNSSNLVNANECEGNSLLLLDADNKFRNFLV